LNARSKGLRGLFYFKKGRRMVMRRFGGKFLAGFILGICSIGFLASWVFAEIQKTGEDRMPLPLMKDHR